MPSPEPVASSGSDAAAGASRSTDSAPGLREEIGATRGAVLRLVRAHVDLARTEIGEILDEVKRMAALVGVAIAMLLFVGILVPVGACLWLGEWLFGSMGWGILHGTEASIGLAVALVVMAIGRPGGRIAGLFVLAAVVGILVGLALGLDWPNQAYRQVGDASFTGIDPGYRPLIIGAAVGALVVGVLGLLVGAAGGGGGGAVGGLFLGAILGLLVGAFSAITFDRPAGAGVGVAVALGLWPILVGIDTWRAGIDTEALKARFTPTQTIETTKETIEWVRQQTPLGPKP
ncbi:MAG TPA: phage holin family protein [Candidatus Limnocylindrales bacterium]